MSPDDVPSPIDFHDPAQAQGWVDQTVAKRPSRPRFFAAFADAVNGFSSHPVSILELGSGPGHLAGALLAVCRISRYVALDFSNAMHDLARAHLDETASRVEFLQADFRAPNWHRGLGPFDVVVTHQAAHETRHKQRLIPFLRQARQCLTPHGLLLYCDHYAETGSAKNSALFLDKAEQTPALEEAGFSGAACLMDEGGMALYRAIA